MKQSKYFIPAFLILTISSQAQPNTQYVLNTAGGHTIINGKHFEYSLGELFTITGLAAGVKNTPGILQPYISPNAGLLAPSSLIFTAQRKNEGVSLHWINTPDPELLQFDVEYDNGREWVILGEVRPVNPDSTSRYYFVHDAPKNGNNQYRLKLNRGNGNFSYSPLRNVIIEETVPVNIYPNPASRYIVISGIRSEDIRQVLFIDMSGKQVIQPAPVNGQQIDIRNLTTGAYIIRIIKKSGEEITQKILVQK